MDLLIDPIAFPSFIHISVNEMWQFKYEVTKIDFLRTEYLWILSIIGNKNSLSFRKERRDALQWKISGNSFTSSFNYLMTFESRATPDSK